MIVISREKLAELARTPAAVEQFDSLRPAALYLKRVDQLPSCKLCPKLRNELPEDLYATIVGSAQFLSQASRLAGWLGAPLLIPGRAEPVSVPAR